MLYCKNCKKIFKDTWTNHDTRTNNKLMTNCPFCISNNIINLTLVINAKKNSIVENMILKKTIDDFKQ